MILIATSLLDDLRLYDDGSAALIETHGEIERRNGGRTADYKDIGKRAAIDAVAGGAVKAMRRKPPVRTWGIASFICFG
jgi:hypothetical protein